MQIYFDCPSVCLVYRESIGDMCACVSERAGSETQKDTENYSDVLYYSPIHLHSGFFPLRAIKIYFISINILDYQSKVRKIYIHFTQLMQLYFVNINRCQCIKVHIQSIIVILGAFYFYKNLFRIIISVLWRIIFKSMPSRRTDKQIGG